MRCAHCGLERTMQSNSSAQTAQTAHLCERCRLDYCFCYQSGKEEVVYKWCFRCKVFHAIQFFWNHKFGAYDVCCQQQETPAVTTLLREVVVENKEEKTLLADIESTFSRHRDRLTRIFLLEMRKTFHQNLNGVCCVCLDAEVPTTTDRRVRYLGLRLSRYGNHHNPACR